MAATPALSYSAVHVDGPFIAMTFDDGPSEKLTPELLDILAPHHIHATFFVIGKNAVTIPRFCSARCARAMRSAITAGHTPLSAKCGMKACGLKFKRRMTPFAPRLAPGPS